MKKTKSILLLILGASLSASAMRATNSVVQTVDTRDYILTVTSPYGVVSVPAGGASTNSWHSMVYSQVVGYPVIETGGETQHSPSGFNGEGTAPASGSGDSAFVTLTNVNSTITWEWINWHLLHWEVFGQGAVQPVDMAYSGNGAWCIENENYQLRAVPSYGWLFTGWNEEHLEGPSATNLNISISEPTMLQTYFSDDPDGDGLKNTDEELVGANPWMVNTDGDDYDDLFEFNNGLSPTRDSSSFLTHIQNSPETYGLYSSNAVLDVAIGQVVLGIEGATARLSLQIEQSDDLGVWTNAGDTVEWTMPVSGDKKFLRVRSGK